MISQRQVHQHIRTELENINGIHGVWDNRAHDQLPEDQNGHILPGVILQWRVPMAVHDVPLSDEQFLDARIYRIQMRPFAATVEVLMDMTDAIIEHFTGMRIHRGIMRHSVEEEPVWPFQHDPDINVPYSVLYWRVATQ